MRDDLKAFALVFLGFFMMYAAGSAILDAIKMIVGG